MPTGFPDYYGGLTLPVTVPEGGTGQTSITSKAMLYGAGSSKLIETNVGTANQVLQIDSVSLNPTFKDLVVDVSAITGILPIANGGTGTATPGLVAGTNVQITGSWPNNTLKVQSPVILTSQAITDTPLLIKGIASQSHVLFQIIDHTGANLLYVDATGNTVFGQRVTFAGGANISLVAGSSRFTFTLTGPSGFGFSGGTTNIYLAYADTNTRWINNSLVGDFCEINNTGRLLFSTSTSAAGMILASNILTLLNPLPITSGGTGTATPALVAGANIVITGTWPDNTIAVASSPTFTDNPPVLSINTTNATEKRAYINFQQAGVTFYQIISDTGATGIADLFFTNSATGHRPLILHADDSIELYTPLAKAYGGTGTATPALVAGANIVITGTWPANTIALNANPSITTLTCSSPGTGEQDIIIVKNSSSTGIAYIHQNTALGGVIGLYNHDQSNSLILRGGEADPIDWNSGKFTLNLSGVVSAYNGVATAGVGLPSIVAVADLTGQTASISSTTIYTPAAAGFYRLSIEVFINSTTGSSTLTVTTGFYQNGQGVGIANLINKSGSGAALIADASERIYSDSSQPIQYSTSWTSGGGSDSYDIHIRLERI